MFPVVMPNYSVCHTGEFRRTPPMRTSDLQATPSSARRAVCRPRWAWQWRRTNSRFFCP